MLEFIQNGFQVKERTLSDQERETLREAVKGVFSTRTRKATLADLGSIITMHLPDVVEDLRFLKSDPERPQVYILHNLPEKPSFPKQANDSPYFHRLQEVVRKRSFASYLCEGLFAAVGVERQHPPAWTAPYSDVLTRAKEYVIITPARKRVTYKPEAQASESTDVAGIHSLARRARNRVGADLRCQGNIGPRIHQDGKDISGLAGVVTDDAPTRFFHLPTLLKEALAAGLAKVRLRVQLRGEGVGEWLDSTVRKLANALPRIAKDEYFIVEVHPEEIAARKEAFDHVVQGHAFNTVAGPGDLLIWSNMGQLYHQALPGAGKGEGDLPDRIVITHAGVPGGVRAR